MYEPCPARRAWCRRRMGMMAGFLAFLGVGGGSSWQYSISSLSSCWE